jgi:hypothetical protein
VEERSTYFEAGTADRLLECVLGWLEEEEEEEHPRIARL